MSECFDYIKKDLYRYTGRSDSRAFLKQYFKQGEGFRFSVWLRICYFSKRHKIARFTVFPIAYVFFRHYKFKYGYDFSYDTPIGPGLLIFHINGIVFRPEKAGKNITVSQCTTVGMTIHGGKKKYPVLGDNIYIAPGSKIIGGITIGDDVSIGANAVATKDVEDHAVVVGIPGKIISYNGATEYINNPVE